VRALRFVLTDDSMIEPPPALHVAKSDRNGQTYLREIEDVPGARRIEN
jgi:hypothetical protein